MIIMMASTSNCHECQAELEHGRNQHQCMEKENVVGTASSITSDISILSPVSHVQLQARTGLWKATIAVDGMTCSSCVNAITTLLRDQVVEVSVSLLTNSAFVTFNIEEITPDEVVSTIEDAGYEAVLDTLIEVKIIPAQPSPARTVEIAVNGIYCRHCPTRLVNALNVLAGVSIDKSPDLASPIFKITYLPTPTVHIRIILETLNRLDERLTASIYHPQTLAERSRYKLAIERRNLLVRILLTVVTAIPTFAIGIVVMTLLPSTNPVKHFFMQPLAVGVSRSQWSLFIMATPVYFFAADIFHRQAVKQIYHLWKRGSRTPPLQRFYKFGSMSMLISLGTSVAYFSSVAQLVAAAAGGATIVDDGSFYFDSVVFLTLFLLVGRLIEAYSKAKTGDAVAMLSKLRPSTAILVEKVGAELKSNEVQVDLLEVGDVINVLYGAASPCDGLLLNEAASFDESSLTGESKLVKKKPNDSIFAGTINKGSPARVQITGAAGSSMLDQIVSAVQEGQTRRAPIERVADKLTSVFVPIVVFIALLTWITWMGLSLAARLPTDYNPGHADWTVWSLQFAIAVFVVACPCGLGLAAPTAIFVGGGLAAKHGILVKGGGEAFEKASRLDCVVFDKTGTLTMGGQPTVTDHRFNDDTARLVSPKILCGILSALEENSSHPIAKALHEFCRLQHASQVLIKEVVEVPGKGIHGTTSSGDSSMNSYLHMLVGNESLMQDYGVTITPALRTHLERWKEAGKSIVLVAIGHDESNATPKYSLYLILSVSDPVRPEAKSVVSRLCAQGTSVWMLSGDNSTTANAVGAHVGIPSTNIISGVLPFEKSEKIRYLQNSITPRSHMTKSESENHATVAMVGDGINDAAALTTADIGIAIGSGSDIAISSAEFVLLTSNLNNLITLLSLSKAVFRRVKFNFAWALVYNLTALPVAAGVLYPLRTADGNHIRLDPVWASLAMALSSVSVVVSSLALRSGIPLIGFKEERFSDEDSDVIVAGL